MPLRNLLASILLSSTLAGAGQTETLLPSGGLGGGWFGGPAIRLGPVNGQSGVLVGGRGGWLLHPAFSIGGGGYGLANRVEADRPDSLRLDLGYGGFIMEGALRPHKAFHAAFSLLIGGGSVNMHEGRHRGDADWDATESFFVLEPEAGLEINVLPFFRLCPGVGYRWIAGDTRYLDSDWDISGFTGNLTFKFGRF